MYVLFLFVVILSIHAPNSFPSFSLSTAVGAFILFYFLLIFLPTSPLSFFPFFYFFYILSTSFPCLPLLLLKYIHFGYRLSTNSPNQLIQVPPVGEETAIKYI